MPESMTTDLIEKMDPTTVAQEILKHLDFELGMLIVGTIFIIVIGILLKNVSEGIASYIMFRLDPHISIGTPVEIYGHRGRIKDASWSEIVIETEEGHIRIPPKAWKGAKYIVLKDHVLNGKL